MLECPFIHPAADDERGRPGAQMSCHGGQPHWLPPGDVTRRPIARERRHQRGRYGNQRCDLQRRTMKGVMRCAAQQGERMDTGHSESRRRKCRDCHRLVRPDHARTTQRATATSPSASGRPTDRSCRSARHGCFNNSSALTEADAHGPRAFGKCRHDHFVTILEESTHFPIK